MDTLANENLTAPLAKGTFMQRLASFVLKIRDQHIVQQIFQALHNHKKVLIIYGSSHFATQRRIVTQYLGRPTYVTTCEGFLNLAENSVRRK